ncbi:MAG: NAD-dependent epimerase/dehydratase family protein, partial [Candidatus Pacebacteria bacterium]|nr:NAD-dependent epimerase/dehydratase family protein [Candidatus Paceibacterota bacterium]
YYDVQLKQDREQILKKSAQYAGYHFDLNNQDKLEQVFQKHQINKICHLAAQPGVRYSLQHPLVYGQANLTAFIKILEAARKFAVKNIVFASSSSIYGANQMPKTGFSEQDVVTKPISLYGATKLANEMMAYSYHHLYQLNLTGLRFFTVYGPWGRPDMAPMKFSRLISQDQPLEVYNHGKMQRDFTYIDDIVAGILAALEKQHSWEIINLGNSEPIKLLRFINLLEKHLGKKAKKKMLPLQPGDLIATFANIDKAKKLLGFEPKINLEQGLKEFTDWYQDYYLT